MKSFSFKIVFRQKVGHSLFENIVKKIATQIFWRLIDFLSIKIRNKLFRFLLSLTCYTKEAAFFKRKILDILASLSTETKILIKRFTVRFLLVTIIVIALITICLESWLWSFKRLRHLQPFKKPRDKAFMLQMAAHINPHYARNPSTFIIIFSQSINTMHTSMSRSLFVYYLEMDEFRWSEKSWFCQTNCWL